MRARYEAEEADKVETPRVSNRPLYSGQAPAYGPKDRDVASTPTALRVDSVLSSVIDYGTAET